MSQKSQVYKETFKTTGYWKYSEVYDFVFNWLRDRHYKTSEDSYNEKIQSNGKEVTITWKSSKSVSDYFKFTIQMEWHILGMKDVEVEIDGKKKKTNHGEVEIAFKGFLVKDYEQRWEDKPIWKFLRGVYEKYVIRSTVADYEDELEDDVRELIGDLKAFLRLEAPTILRRP